MNQYKLEDLSALRGRFKMVALDLDGTLLRANKTIGERNVQALREAAGRGCRVVLTSGRHPSSVAVYAQILGCLGRRTSHAVIFNGAAVISLNDYVKSGRQIGFPLLYAQTANGEEIAAITELAHQHGCRMHGYSRQRGLVVEDFNPNSQREIVHNFVPLRVADFGTLRARETFFKVLAVGAPEALDSLRAALPPEIFTRFSVLRSDPNFLEFIPGCCTKGTALYELCKIIGCELSEVVAFGDAENDQAMIRSVGLGVAMANAQDCLKETADVITLSNQEDGVAAVVEKLF